MVINFRDSEPPTIDRDQALAHLSSLGYKANDVVYLRFFFPEGDPRKKDDLGRKLEGKFPNLPWNRVNQMQMEGRGCYFVVNGGGHADKNVTEGRAVFYEHDNLSKDLQRDLWQRVGLPEPTIQVDSGGKSIHTKWKLTNPCTPKQWRELQVDLLEFVDGDRKLCNPSRVMRLGGAHHIKPGREPIQSQIILKTDNAYSYEELRAIVPRQQKQESEPSQTRWHEFDQNFNLPIEDSVPLYECLSRADRDLIDRGIGEGNRNSSGFALAANLIATTDYLGSIGQRYEGEPRRLFEQYAQNCTPPIDGGEVEQIWKSANRRTKSTSLPPDAIENCIKGWKWRRIRNEAQKPQKLHQETIEEVSRRADADIVNIIGEHISLQKRGKDFVGICPFHVEQRLPSSRSPSLAVNPQKQFFSCSECATGGNCIRFLTVFGRHSFTDVVLDLARRYQIQPRSTDGETIVLPTTPLTFEKPVIGVPEGNVVDHPTASRRHQPISEDELHQRIDDLISQDLQPSKLTTKLSLLAKETGLQPADIKRIYYEREQEKEQAESRPECAAEIEDLLKVGISSLKLVEELPAIYAQPLIKLAKHLSLREEVYLLALLSALSVCHRSRTKLIIHRGQGFSVPLNLFAAIVSESGQRKSPVIKEIITAPLRVLQREAKAEHQAAIAKYEADLESWNSLDKDGREVDFPNGIPQEPLRQKVYFFTSTSGSEAINRQIDAHPDQPLIYLKDEVMGVFTQQGKYSQGRGSEKQDFLSYYDGTGATELLTDGVRSDTEIILMSIFGSVQPEILRKFTKDCSDPDGQWARFLWVNQPLAAATLRDDDGGSINITDLLAGLYRQTCELPAIEYTLSPDAFKVYQKAYNRIEHLRINCPDPGMRAVYSKATGQLGRLIGNCHVIYELAAEREPSAEIPVERVKQGIRLIKFFIEQTKIIRSESNASKGELPDILAKIIRLSQRLGRLKAKQVQKNYESIKLTPDQIRNTFLELQAMGYGPTYGKGNRMEWEYQPQIDPPNRQAGGEGNDDDGGYPKKSNLSPTAPTAPTGGENHYREKVSAVGEIPTESPTAPTVLLTTALEQEEYDAAWISVKGENGTSKQVVGETVGAVGGTVGDSPTVESTQAQGFQETVGAVGAVGVFSQESIQKEDCHTSVRESCNLSVPSPTAPTVNYCQQPESTEATATALEVEVGDEWLDPFEDRFEAAAQKAFDTEAAIAPSQSGTAFNESQPSEWNPQIGDRVWRTAFGYPEGPYIVTTRPGDKFMVVNDGLPYEKTARYYRLRAADGSDTAIYECGKVEHLRPVESS